MAKKRLYRPIGLQMRDFGRKHIARYYPSGELPADGVQAPPPLDETPDAPTLPPVQPIQRERVTPPPRPTTPPPTGQPAPADDNIDPRLLRILSAHDPDASADDDAEAPPAEAPADDPPIGAGTTFPVEPSQKEINRQRLQRRSEQSETPPPTPPDRPTRRRRGAVIDVPRGNESRQSSTPPSDSESSSNDDDGDESPPERVSRQVDDAPAVPDDASDTTPTQAPVSDTPPERVSRPVDDVPVVPDDASAITPTQAPVSDTPPERVSRQVDDVPAVPDDASAITPTQAPVSDTPPERVSRQVDDAPAVPDDASDPPLQFASTADVSGTPQAPITRTKPVTRSPASVVFGSTPRPTLDRTPDDVVAVAPSADDALGSGWDVSTGVEAVKPSGTRPDVSRAPQGIMRRSAAQSDDAQLQEIDLYEALMGTPPPQDTDHADTRPAPLQRTPDDAQLQEIDLYEALMGTPPPQDTDHADTRPAPLQRTPDRDPDEATTAPTTDLLDLLGLPADTRVEGGDILDTPAPPLQRVPLDVALEQSAREDAEMSIVETLPQRGEGQAPLQRAPSAPTDTPASASSTDESATDDEESDDELVERLARRVYRMIKDKLRIERERHSRK